MSEQIREQVSAFLDGELPNSETELLLKRLTRDPELRDSFGRYALIGEAMRGTHRPALTQGFATRVNAAIDGEPLPESVTVVTNRTPRWWRPFAGAAVVASVAAVAVVALQHRALGPVAGTVTAANVQRPAASNNPSVRLAPGALQVASTNPVPAAGTREPPIYTTPVSTGEPAPVATGRMASYVFAHSKYSSGLGQRGVLADLLIDDDAPPAKPVPAAAPAPTP